MKGQGEGKGNQYKLIYTVGSKSSKPTDTNYMKQVNELDTNEKAQTDVVCWFNNMRECISRIEKLDEAKSDKLVYKLPAINLCSYSLI